MLRSLWKPLSANAVQLLLNQALGLMLFVLLARGLGKEAFGQLNGLLATLLLAFSVLSFGIDQLLVRKTAAGEDPGPMLAAALAHNAAWGGLFVIVLVALLPFHAVPLLPLLVALALGKWVLFLGTPFKNIANGQERFRLLLYMSVVANALKAAGVGLLLSFGKLTMTNTVAVFAVSDALEAVVCLLLYRRTGGARITFCRKRYTSLLREALPQTGTVLFAAALSRFDWIYLAATQPATELAEYSFAYKVFELAQLPLLMIAPLLVPRFTRALRTGLPDPGLRKLAQLEWLLAAITVVALNIAWQPAAAWVSQGKYGASNAGVIVLLSLVLPVLYYNNFLWSRLFAEGRTGLIFRMFALTFGVNLVANLALVPRWGGTGAAAAFLLAMLVQTAGYHFATPAPRSVSGWRQPAAEKIRIN